MIQFFKNSYKKMPLTRKIMFYFIPLSIIPLLLVNFIVSSNYENLIINRTLSSALDNSNLTITQIESIFDSAQDCGNQLTININNIYVEALDDQSVTSQVTLMNRISNELKFSLLTYANIESLAFYDTEGNLFTSTHLLSDKNDKFYHSHMFETLSQTTGLNHWFSMMYRDYLVIDSDIAVLSMGKKIVNINDGSTLGYLIINIPEPTINHLLSLQTYNYWIINENNQIISTNNNDTVLNPLDKRIFDNQLLNQKQYNGVRTLNDQKYVTTMLPFNTNEWRLIGQLPYKELTKDLQQITVIVLILMVVIVIIAVLSSWFFSSNITKPIKSLNQGMFKVSHGDFSLRIEPESADEIGTMAESFNHMSAQIEDLLHKIELEQEQKRNYEMALIQEQIKPHFLYNCLDVIYTLNIMGRSKDAAKATKALADYYRISLSKGADIISLVEEIRSLEDYLYLQQIRYSDVFDYDITFPNELAGYKIFKLALQPIVENAIYHGLKESETFGHLHIDITKIAGDIHITITDNGLGIDEYTLKQLLNYESRKDHFGIYNVHHRIQLFFGDTYGLTIESKLGEGTKVTLKIPATTTIT